MKAYLYTGLRSQFQQGRVMESCCSLILCGAGEEESRKAFEAWLLSSNEGESPIPTKVIKIVGAPVLDRLLTESDYTLIDWDGICREAEQSLQAAAGQSGQGYWVESDLWVKPGKLSPNIEWLRRDLPEEVRADLNWFGDRTYFFLVSVLHPPVVNPVHTEESQSEGMAIRGLREEGPDVGAPSDRDNAEHHETFPELVEKELAVLVRARNALVAAWRWRKYAASTLLAGNPIRIDAWCGAISIENGWLGRSM